MEVFINNAILHVLNNDGRESFFSTQELDIDSDICVDFIVKHIKKMINNPSTKEATFNPESFVYSVIGSYKNGEINFKEASTQICSRLSGIMLENIDIPSGDILLAQFEIKNDAYFGIFKLNFKECFTHQIGGGENGTDNQIVKYNAVLPYNNGKVEEACIIPYNPMIIKLLEKAYNIGGEQTNYFSKLFLDCSPELSQAEAAAIINEITEEISEKFYNEKDVETASKIKIAILEEAMNEDGIVSVANIANNVFSDNEEAKKEYIEAMYEAGIKPDLYLGEKFTKQKFGVHKFKADNGIELKFPCGLTDDPNIIEFINNSDGSISIMLKNLRKG